MLVTTTTELFKKFIQKLLDYDMTLTRAESLVWLPKARDKFEELCEDEFLYWPDEGTDYIALFWLKNDELCSGLYRIPTYDDDGGDDTQQLISDLADIVADEEMKTKARLQACKVLQSFLAEQVKKEEMEAERENPPF